MTEGRDAFAEEARAKCREFIEAIHEEQGLVLDPIRTSYKRWLVGGNWRPVADVIAARLGNKAGLVGAADLAREPDPIM